MRSRHLAAILMLTGAVALADEPQPTLVGDTQFLPAGPIAIPGEIPVPEALPAEMEPLKTIVYPVVDLVVEFEPPDSPFPSDVIQNALVEALRSESSPIPTMVRSTGGDAKQKQLENLSELSVLLQSTVSPESWDAAGGRGHIAVHSKTLSFVIRQTKGAHNEINDLLLQLRRIRDISVELEAEFFSSDSKDASSDETADDPSMGEIMSRLQSTLTRDQATAVRKTLTSHCVPGMHQRLTLQNGVASKSLFMTCTPVISADRRAVRLNVVQNIPLGFDLLTDGPGSFPTSSLHRLPDGGSVLIPLMFGDETIFALLTARIQVPEEEEELLEASPLPTQAVSGVGINSEAGVQGCITITEELVGPPSLLALPPVALSLIASDEGPYGIQILQLIGLDGEGREMALDDIGDQTVGARGRLVPVSAEVEPLTWTELLKLRTSKKKTKEAMHSLSPAPTY